MLRINSVLKPVEALVRQCRPSFSRHVVDEIEYVLHGGMLREGTCTARFEDCFRKRTQAQYAYSVSSGTAALHLGLLSCFDPGSKVLVPGFSFIASASMVVHAGGLPVFVDVDPETFLLDLDNAWEKTDERTSAVVPVHLFGNVVPYDGLLELAEEYDLRIVHDAAQALGSTYMGAELGDFSDVSCYSFYPSKIITTGEGGMLTTNNEELGHRVGLLKNQGEAEKYRHTLLGYNYRGNEVASVLGLDQMTRLDYFLEKRRSIARYYNLAIGNIEGVSPQRVTEGTESCYNYYTVRVDPCMGLDRDRIVMDMRNMNIETTVHYPVALTEQPALRKYVTEPCPAAEELARNVFSIPIHPYLSGREAEQVVLALRTAVHRYL